MACMLLGCPVLCHFAYTYSIVFHITGCMNFLLLFQFWLIDASVTVPIYSGLGWLVTSLGVACAKMFPDGPNAF